MLLYSDKVLDSYKKLTHSQRIVADYALENLNTLAFATLDDIAMRIGVSTTTIIRFARMLGFSGYSDMQKEIQNEVMDKISLPERLSNNTGTYNSNDLIVGTMQNDIENIKNTVSEMPTDILVQTIAEILKARNIYVLGMRSSFALAHYTSSRLGQIRPNVRLIQSVGMIFPEEIAGSSSEDICIAFMFPRYSRTTANLIKWLKRTNVRIILFTSPNQLAAQDYGDIILPCYVKGYSFKNTYTAPMCIVNYLMAAVALESDDTIETLKQTEEFLSNGFYLGF